MGFSQFKGVAIFAVFTCTAMLPQALSAGELSLFLSSPQVNILPAAKAFVGDQSVDKQPVSLRAEALEAESFNINLPGRNLEAYISDVKTNGAESQLAGIAANEDITTEVRSGIVYDQDNKPTGEIRIVNVRRGSEVVSRYIKVEDHENIYDLNEKNGSATLEVKSTKNEGACGSDDNHTGVSDLNISSLNQGGAARPSVGAPVVLRVEVVFPPQALAAVGGVDGVVSHQAAWEAEANEVLQNSGITGFTFMFIGALTSTNQMGSVTATYNEVSLDQNGAFATVIREARENTRADLIVVMDEHPYDSYCGISHFPNDAKKDLLVVNRPCADNHRSFIHEMGHSMGAAHRPGDNGSSWTFSTGGAGHRFNDIFGSCWNTVMSYTDVNCPNRAPHFSNPAKTYWGTATGITGQRDNASVVSTYGPIVAGYRTGDSSPTTPPPVVTQPEVTLSSLSIASKKSGRKRKIYVTAIGSDSAPMSTEITLTCWNKTKVTASGTGTSSDDGKIIFLVKRKRGVHCQASSDGVGSRIVSGA